MPFSCHYQRFNLSCLFFTLVGHSNNEIGNAITTIFWPDLIANESSNMNKEIWEKEKAVVYDLLID